MELEEKVGGEDSDYEIELVNESPIINALRYTVMRIVRIVLAMACEVASWVVAGFVGVYAWLLMSWAFLIFLDTIGMLIYFLEHLNPPDAHVLAYWKETGVPEWYSHFPVIGETWANEWAFVGPHPTLWQWLGQHVYIAFPIAVALLVLLYSQALALGLPYRTRNTAPGSNVVRCEHCKKKIPEGLLCPECHKFRGNGLAIKAIWAVNVFISSIWVTHDALSVLIGMSGGRRGGKK